jgi:putative peptidoglycan lipid II flippase
VRDPAARHALLLMVPRALGLGATQVTFIVNTALATGLGTGAVVAYNIAFTLAQIPIGVIGVPLGIVLLPSLSRAASTGAAREFATLVTGSVRMILFVMLFLTAVGIVVARDALAVLFGSGRLDPATIDAGAVTLAVFLLALAPETLVAILARAFYANKDTLTPVRAALLAVAIHVTVSLVTVTTLGLAGLALGIVIGGTVEAALLCWVLVRRRGITSATLLSAVALDLVGSVGAAVAAFAVLTVARLASGADVSRIGRIVETGLAVAAATAVYVAFAAAMRVPELGRIVALARSGLRGVGAPADR